MAQTIPSFGIQILENAIKRKQGNYTRKRMSDDPNREKVHRETGNIEDLVKRKGISDMSKTTAFDRTRSALGNSNRGMGGGRVDGYYVAYKPITLPSILFMFVEIKFIHCHSCVMFAMKSMSMCND